MDIRTLGTSPTSNAKSSESNTPAAPSRASVPTLAENAVQQQVSPPTTQQIEEALQNINKAVQAQGIEFSIDSESDIPVVKVVDIETKEVLRQLPSEEALAIAKALDRAQGLLIKQKA